MERQGLGIRDQEDRGGGAKRGGEKLVQSRVSRAGHGAPGERWGSRLRFHQRGVSSVQSGWPRLSLGNFGVTYS